MKTLITAVLLVLSSSSFAQVTDCTGAYNLFNVKDSLSWLHFNLSVIIDLGNTGYASMFFVSAAGDTLNPHLSWSQQQPSGSNSNPDTTEHFVSFVNGFTSMPANFVGSLVIRNPDCEIPYNHATASINSLSATSRAVLAFPNPSTGFIAVEIPKGFALEQWKVRALSGQELFSGASMSALESTAFPKGCYVLSLESERELLQTRFIVL